MVRATFSVLDYILFVVCILISLGIGVYFGFFKKQKSTKDVLLGNRQLGILPVAMTLMASFLSAISILGYPNEIYTYGTMFCFYGMMYFITFPLAAYLFLPVFYNLELTSAYEYLEIRFDRKVRQTASVAFIFQILLYLGVVLYAPSLALSSVTELSLAASILTTGILATVYTSIGGARAVVYTSSVQMVLIIGGLLAVVIGGSVSQGGLHKVWQIAEEGGRIQFNDFRLDPKVRHSFWSLMIGGTCTVLTLFGTNQMTVQRYLSMRSLRSAQIALLINIPVNQIMIVLYTLAGLIMYAEYSQCDPLHNGMISKSDQRLPYYVMQKLGVATGLPGLFVASLFGAALSTLSGGFNAIAAVFFEDFVKPIYHGRTGRQMEEKLGTRLCKGLALFFGLLATGLSFLFDLFENTVLKLVLSIFGIVGGPLLGVFSLGMFFPWANRHGALAGLLVGLVVNGWFGLGPVINKVISTTPLSVGTNCSSPSNLSSFLANHTRALEPHQSGALDDLYKLSYQYYALTGLVIVLAVGMGVSALTGLLDPKAQNPKLFIPVYRKLFCCCPKKLRDATKCGIEFEEMRPTATAAALIPDEEFEKEFFSEKKLSVDGSLVEETGEAASPLLAKNSTSSL